MPLFFFFFFILFFSCIFFFNDTATTEIYTLSLHDALPISMILLFFIAVPITLRHLPDWDESYQVEIPQQVGGQLVCDVAYSCDIHDCDSHVEYNYAPTNDTTVKVGDGVIDGRVWDRDVQIQKIENVLALPVNSKYNPAIFISTDDGHSWREHKFTDDIITAEVLWQKEHIESFKIGRAHV